MVLHRHVCAPQNNEDSMDCQNHCLRAIWKIKAAYISRVSNKQVLETKCCSANLHKLMKQQLLFFGKVASAPSSTIRKCAARVGLLPMVAAPSHRSV